ncbi:MAG: hypothetical protein A2908_02165 [Candidatus Staskawiczbacteria bacterium RIFCSPLOWO2_01_FULL_38_12b]|uniref:Uncharacterized protein n=1 Tax=Candidatus Staskawiczbacteria bacterium RIFCSPLOWO2_01_FULL_38_12b TaxID=1802214 RepID=A0A1G2IFE7_9BACT|nr:MAG: hypothetical protein A2908_02165 [Candidatus Staskawiczbacteria bacterium RIFCSPLOWO2_01_FULL_38_12b]
MKKASLIILYILAGLILILAIYFGIYVYKKSSYAHKIDSQVLDEITNLFNTENSYSHDVLEEYILKRVNNNPKKITWGDDFLRIEFVIDYESVKHTNKDDYTSIKISSDQGKTWKEIIRSEDMLCDYGIIHKDLLYCFTKYWDEPNTFTLRIINKEGGIISKESFGSPEDSVANIFGVHKSNNILVITWIDDRTQYYEFYGIPFPFETLYENIFGWLGDIFRTGPSVIMAGKLNLDTLEWKEYVIQYGDSNKFDPAEKAWQRERELEGSK